MRYENEVRWAQEMIYNYPKDKIEPEVHYSGRNRNFERYKLTFPSWVKSEEKVNNLVHGLYFKPLSREKSSAVIFLHGWGTRKKVSLEYFPSQLASQGVATFFLTLPFHLERTPQGERSGSRFITPQARECLQSFRQAVIDIKVSLDWLEEREEIKENEISVMGISLGAMVATIAMGVEERLKKGIFILGGGNLERIVWQGLATFPLRREHIRAGITAKDCQEVHKSYPKYLEEVEKAGQFEEITPTKECFLFDPLTFAHRIRGREVIMINALFDLVVPRKSTLELWEALSKPKIIWLFSTHFSFYFWRKPILKEVVQFLKGDQ